MTALSPRKHPPGLARLPTRMLNFIAAIVIAAGLIAPLRRIIVLFAFLVANGAGLRKIRTRAR
jgi:hypothetical protein